MTMRQHMSLLWFFSADQDAEVGVRSGHHCLTWPEPVTLYLNLGQRLLDSAFHPT